MKKIVLLLCLGLQISLAAAQKTPTRMRTLARKKVLILICRMFEPGFKREIIQGSSPNFSYDGRYLKYMVNGGVRCCGQAGECSCQKAKLEGRMAYLALMKRDPTTVLK